MYKTFILFSIFPQWLKKSSIYFILQHTMGGYCSGHTENIVTKKDWFLEIVMWSHLLAINNILKWSIKAWFGIFMQMETHPWKSQRQYKYRRVDNNDVVRVMLLYNTTTDKTTFILSWNLLYHQIQYQYFCSVSSSH